MKNIKNIYMIGICGVAMGSLAGMLKERGYHVSGSDEHVYPPMSDMLRQWDITAYSGFKESQVGSPDLVIIGNAISRGNVEAEHVLNKRIPYCSMSQALYDFFLKEKEIVAIAGTHGKTTTTALLAHIMESAGLSPSFFVGGVANNYNSNFKLGSGRFFVIEGDEYDSAFFEKVPKVVIYRPHHLVLTSLEFDHADIYGSLDEILLWFKRLVNIVPSNGNIVYSAAYPVLKKALTGALSRCFSFGDDGSDFSCRLDSYEEGNSMLKLAGKNGAETALCTKLFGDFNFANIAAAAGMALLLGLDAASIKRGVDSFEGVKRRQELIYSKGNIKIFEDFAHHPTAISSVLETMKKRFPGSKVFAVYEPRSATSRRNVFQNELPGAFARADEVFIKSPYMPEKVPEADRIDINRVVTELNNNGTNAGVMNNVLEIIDGVFRGIDVSRENIIVIMSNGGFDGIYDKIKRRAEELHACC